MSKLYKATTLELDCTPREVAVLFANMSDDEHALFFNEIACLVKEWDKQTLAFQLSFVCHNKLLTDEGRQVMREIGDYADKPVTVVSASAPPRQ